MLRHWGLALVCALVCAISNAAPEENSGTIPVIYLTFDDGPSRDGVTEQILDVLDRFNAKATFFVTGARVRANPEKIERIAGAGHAIGNHTLNHGQLTSLEDQEVVAEFSATNQHVLSAGGPVLSCFRAPFGATNQRVNGIATQMGLEPVSWTIDTRDWDAYTDRDYIATQLEDSRHESVVLMHDGPNFRWRTLEVFTHWMENVGHLYNFEPLPECVESNREVYASLPEAQLLPEIESLPEAQLLPEAQPILAELQLAAEQPVTEVSLLSAEVRLVSDEALLEGLSATAEAQMFSEEQLPEALLVATEVRTDSEVPSLSETKQKPVAQPVSESMPVDEAVVKPPLETTIPQLLAKLRNYQIALGPETMVQSIAKN